MDKSKAILRYVDACRRGKLTDDIVSDVDFLPVSVQNDILANVKKYSSSDVKKIVMFYGGD